MLYIFWRLKYSKNKWTEIKLYGMQYECWLDFGLWQNSIQLKCNWILARPFIHVLMKWAHSRIYSPKFSTIMCTLLFSIYDAMRCYWFYCDNKMVVKERALFASKRCNQINTHDIRHWVVCFLVEIRRNKRTFHTNTHTRTHNHTINV